jgi:hypothetical protein
MALKFVAEVAGGAGDLGVRSGSTEIGMSEKNMSTQYRYCGKPSSIILCQRADSKYKRVLSKFQNELLFN